MGEDEKTKILYWFIATLIGSVGLNQGISKVTPSVRSDPFTGTQGILMERRVDKLETELSVLLWRMEHCERTN